MSVTREELHQLVEQLDDDVVPDAAELLRELATQPVRPHRHPSWFGALHSGPDFAEHADDILRAELGRPA